MNRKIQRKNETFLNLFKKNENCNKYKKKIEKKLNHGKYTFISKYKRRK